MNWYLKCRDCGATYEENEILPMLPNPSEIEQVACSNCYGALDLKEGQNENRREHFTAS